MNYYAQAIELLSYVHTDGVRLIFEIAKYNPKVLVDAAGRLGICLEPHWKKVCKGLVEAGNKIEAIKLCRKETGMGLKESKEAVEAL